MKKNLFIVYMLCSIMLPALLIASVSATTETSLQDIQTANKIVIGTNAEYPPFENLNPGGDLEGFDIEMGEMIADALEVEVEWKNVGWDGILLGLETGLYDIIISAMTITEEREAQCDFTRWYYQSYQAMMVKVSDTTLTGINQLNTSSVKIGFQEGTMSDNYVTDNIQAAQAFGYDEITHAVAALDAGNIDVVLGDHATLLYAMHQQPDTYKVVEVFSPENFGIACKSGSTSLTNAINEYLNELLGDDPNNPVMSEEYNTIYKASFYDDAPYEFQGSTVPGYPAYFILALIPVATLLIIKKTKKNLTH